MFKHSPLMLPSLTRIDGEQRFYELPTGQRYPSVTTIIDAMSDKKELEIWRDRIGHEEADFYTRKCGRRGSALHNICEKYLLNQELDLKNEMPVTSVLFKQLKPILDENLEEIHFAEGMLYSHKLKAAGTSDVCGLWSGTKAIIDFKTSEKKKTLDWITLYWIQTCAYALMVYELTGIMCPKLVIMIAVESENFPQVFEEKTVDWIDRTALVFSEYHKRY